MCSVGRQDVCKGLHHPAESQPGGGRLGLTMWVLATFLAASQWLIVTRLLFILYIVTSQGEKKEPTLAITTPAHLPTFRFPFKSSKLCLTSALLPLG